jgi:hypothetical protein
VNPKKWLKEIDKGTEAPEKNTHKNHRKDTLERPF